MLSELPEDIIKIILSNISMKEKLSARLVCLFFLKNINKNIHVSYFLENFIRKEFSLGKQLFNKDNYLLRTKTQHFSVYKKLDSYYDVHKGIHPSFFGGFYCSKDCITQSCNEKRLERIHMKDLNGEIKNLQQFNTRYIPYCMTCYLFTY